MMPIVALTACAPETRCEFPARNSSMDQWEKRYAFNEDGQCKAAMAGARNELTNAMRAIEMCETDEVITLMGGANLMHQDQLTNDAKHRGEMEGKKNEFENKVLEQYIPDDSSVHCPLPDLQKIKALSELKDNVTAHDQLAPLIESGEKIREEEATKAAAEKAVADAEWVRTAPEREKAERKAARADILARRCDPKKAAKKVYTADLTPPGGRSYFHACGTNGSTFPVDLQPTSGAGVAVLIRSPRPFDINGRWVGGDMQGRT